MAAATALPVVLYDIPVRAGRRIARDTMVQLARDVTNIVGVKDATGDPAGSARLVAEAPEGFELYSGDDALTLPLLALGAVGAVSVASHWAGEEIAAMVSAWFKGDTDGAQDVERPALRVLRLSRRARPSRTRFRPRRRAAPSAYPPASAGSRSGPPRPSSTTGPAW